MGVLKERIWFKACRQSPVKVTYFVSAVSLATCIASFGLLQSQYVFSLLRPSDLPDRYGRPVFIPQSQRDCLKNDIAFVFNHNFYIFRVVE